MKTFLSTLFSKKGTVEQTTKTTSKSETKVTNPVTTIATYKSAQIDYTKAEIDGILDWEKQTGQRCEELRRILKSKQNSEIKNHLDNYRDVMFLAKKSEEKPELVRQITKDYEGNAKEIVAMVKVAEKNIRYFNDIYNACPELSSSDYQKIMDVYTTFDQRLRSVLSDYHKLLKVKKEIENLQKNNGNEKELLEKFDVYKWLSPDYIKAKISREMIKTTNINDMPMMTIDDLVQKIEDVKNNKGRIDYMTKKFNEQRKSSFDPYTLTYR